MFISILMVVECILVYKYEFDFISFLFYSKNSFSIHKSIHFQSRISEVDLEKAKEHLSTEGLKRKQLLVGENECVISLVNLLPDLENIYCLTVLSSSNNIVKHNSATLIPLLTHTTRDLTISLMKKVRLW